MTVKKYLYLLVRVAHWLNKGVIMSKLIDFHAHIDNSWKTVEELNKIQDENNIEKTIIVSGNMIDSRKIGDFLRGTENYKEDIPNNDFLCEVYAKYPDRYIPFFTLDPEYHLIEDLEIYFKNFFMGIKINPIVLKTSFNSPKLYELLESILDYNLILYTHITLNPLSNLSSLKELARRFPQLKIVIGHMGFSTSDFASIDICENFENIYLESSVGSILAFKEIKKRKLVDKLLFGSEYPLHNPGIEYQKLKLVFDGEDLIKVTRNNTIKLINWVKKEKEAYVI